MSRVRISPDAGVRVTSCPYSSVLALACEGVRDSRNGADTIPARVASRLLSERAVRAIAPLVTPGSSVAPDCVAPGDIEADTDMGSELDRLRSLSVDALATDLDRTYQGRLPAHWVRAGQAPRLWARDLADGLEAMWSAVGPVWRREERLRAREAERAGAAAVRGVLDIVLAQAHPRGLVEDGALLFPDPEAAEIDCSGLDVVLSPGLSGLDLSLSSLDNPYALWLAYPVPPVPAKLAPDPEALEALLTPVRARILSLLDGEWPMAEIAAAVRMSASTATRQIDALWAAGLVDRHREGRTILVHRTDRGTHLLGLYGVGSSRGHKRQSPL